MNIFDIIDFLKHPRLCLVTGIIMLLLLYFLVPGVDGTPLEGLRNLVKYIAYFFTVWGFLGIIREES